MTKTHPDYPQPVAKLLTLGDVRGKLQWADYPALGLTADHVPDLVRMALDDDLHWADSESDEVWAPLHAWRALGQLQAGAAAEPLLTLLSRVDEFNDDWVGEDLPKAFGDIGQPAIVPLARYLADSSHGLWARVAAASSFVKIAQRHPDQRDACVEALTQQLTKFKKLDPILNGSIITDLTDLKAVESAPVMEQAFAADQVDTSIQGDWEDTQIRLGLLSERLTPKPS
jgi:HEAT repeat protein